MFFQNWQKNTEEKCKAVPCHIPTYSHLSNKRGGWNKCGGGAKNGESKNLEVGILQLESSAFVLT